MIHDKNILKTPPVWMGLIAIFTMISCGTYEYSGYDRDGIYASDPKTAHTEPTQSKNEQPIETDDTGYYENYFGQEAQKIEQAQAMIFTDVDAYSSNRPDSTYEEEEEMYYEDGVTYNAGNAAWGSNPTEINVNYYNTGYNPHYYGGWSNFAWGYGYVGSSFFFGWHTPYYGYYNPYYYGYGYYNPYYYGYGYGYNPYYYGHSYYNPYYSRIAQHRNYRNGNRSSYNREAARNRNGNRSSYTRENTRNRNSDARTDRTTRSRVRNPRNVNANAAPRNTNVRTRSTNTRENTRSNTRTRTQTNRNDNTTKSSQRSSSRNNSGSNARKSTRSYSPPVRTRTQSTGTRSSSRGSSGRSGR